MFAYSSRHQLLEYFPHYGRYVDSTKSGGTIHTTIYLEPEICHYHGPISIL